MLWIPYQAVTLIYKFDYLLDEELEKVQKISLCAFNFTLFWYIYYWVKLFHPIHSCKASFLGYGLTSKVFEYEADFANKLILSFSAF